MDWKNTNEIIEFLQKIDAGYTPSKAQISKLSKVTHLYSNIHFEISSIPKSISLLKNLYSLELPNTTISDIDALSTAKSLKSIYIRSTSLEDITPLSKLYNLETLFISSAPIKKIDAIATLQNLQCLYLSYCMVSDITPLSNLKNLRDLQLTGIPVSDISALKELTNLQEIQLNNTRVCDISSLCDLEHLKYINLANSRVTNISPLSGIKNLTKLELDGIPISDVSALKELINLRELSLMRTSIVNAHCLGGLHNLESLSLTNSKGVNIESLTSLTNLRRLSLTKTQISNVDALSNLINLECLYLRENKIINIDALSTLKNLHILDLGYTKISKIPDWVGDLKNLQRLNLQGITLHSIPQNLLQLKLPFEFDRIPWGDGILMDNTKLATQPISLFMQPREMIESYYASEQISINEAKVIFLGDGGAGKTHTIKRLLNGGKKGNYETETTPGIDITNYLAVTDGRQFNIHFWDFGGQEIMHAMHRCFLTERTCYVVILSNRADGDLTARARYWLKNIQSFAPGARVLLAVNRWDNIQSGGLDMNRLIQEYNNLCDTPVHYSAKNSSDADFNLLTKAIIQEASKLDSTAMYFPVQWANIRQELLKMAQDRHYIDKKEYHDICKKQGLDSIDIRTWLLEWFNDLGICFSYHQDKTESENPIELASYKVLNPQWLTNAIYIIINHGKYYAENGKLHINNIRDLLRDPNLGVIKGVTYTDQETDYVLDVMRKFKLSYNVSDNHEFIPALCEPNTPQQLHPNDYKHHISYQMKYTYLPDSVVHQLMIRSYKNLTPEKTWRKGMRIDIMYMGLCAVVDMGSDDSTLRIDVYSQGIIEPWKLLNNIRNDLMSINSDLGLKAKDEIIIRDGNFDIIKPLNELLAAKEQKITMLHIYNEKSNTIKNYHIDEILGITFGKETLEKIEKQADENGQPFSQVFANCKIGVVNISPQSPEEVTTKAMNIINYLVHQQSKINEEVISCLINELKKSQDKEVKELLTEVKTDSKKGTLQKIDEFFKYSASITENGKKIYKVGIGIANAIMAAWPIIVEKFPEIMGHFGT